METRNHSKNGAKPKSLTSRNQNIIKMARQTLKDRSNRIIGYIETDSSGRQTIKDASNRIKGRYDPKTNKTKDSSNRIVGTGNLLTSLL